MNDILTVKNLKVHYPIYGGVFYRQIAKVFAVDGINFSIEEGKTLGLVGESGCGKSTTGRAILNLYKPTSGSICFEGKDLLTLKSKELRNLRKDMQIIFQDPFDSLNARHTVREILSEPFIVHKPYLSYAERNKEVDRLLERVSLGTHVKDKFPHEFSGGQRQRIGIARAIALKPKLVICDEPVSALDVSVQSQIINLLLELQEELNLSYLFIAHDLAVVNHVSDHIAVMYLGKIVEYGESKEVYTNPKHPYTQTLIASIPKPEPGKVFFSDVVKGEIASPANPPSGCHFHPRCPYAQDICTKQEPDLQALSNNDSHLVSCHLAEKLLTSF